MMATQFRLQYSIYVLCVALAILISSTYSSSCFKGGTNSCIFPCHCEGGESCHEDTGYCSQGCDRSNPRFPWESTGCQWGNAALDKPAEQSGSSVHTADRAVDGETSRDYSANTCSNPKDSNPYWYVDLGHEHVVEEINIQTEQNHMHLIQDIRVYVTDNAIENTPVTDDSYLCGMQAGSVGTRVNIRCGPNKMVGQYVTIQRPGTQEMAFCEVAVRGYFYHQCNDYKDNNYWYGPGCLLPCNCNSQCDVITGVCSGDCSEGYHKNTANICTESQCEAGFWGDNCEQQCNCQVTCNPLTGMCPSQCLFGYYGAACDMECSSSCVGSCDRTNGRCTGGCVGGHWGDTCTGRCPVGCSQSCIQSNGHCGSCSSGYAGNRCQNCQIGLWGQDCTNMCNCPNNDAGCDKVTGVCPGCQDGTWGDECQYECHCMNETEACELASGSCQSGCASGYVGNGCDVLLPSLKDANITVVEHNGNFSLEVFQTINSSLKISSYDINYIVLQPGSTVRKSFTVSLPTRARRSAHTEVIYLVWPDFSPNSIYNYTVTPIIDDPSYQGAGISSDLLTYHSGCGTYYHLSPESCHNWCKCSSDSSRFCLLTCDYCYSCSDEPALPSDLDTQVIISEITDTGFRVAIQTSYQHFQITHYEMLHHEVSGVSSETNIIHFDTPFIQVENLTAGTSYVIHVLPVIDIDNTTMAGFPFIVNTSTEAKAAQDSSSKASNTGLIVGISVVSICLMILVITILVIMFARPCSKVRSKMSSRLDQILGKENSNYYYQSSAEMSHYYANSKDFLSADKQKLLYKDMADEMSYYSLPKRQRKTFNGAPIKRQHLHKSMHSKAHQNGGFYEEFKKIPNNTEATQSIASSEANEGKNRFLNIIAYDHSRVTITDRDFYINACFIHGHRDDNEYIASQAPMKNTTSDFWRMVWETQVNTIVMLNKLVETRRKFYRYWPENVRRRYGNVAVEPLATSTFSFYTERHFLLKCNDICRHVMHLQFTAWPDHGVPKHPSEYLEFHSKVTSLHNMRTGPLLVHCAAGVGRTGTFIAIDYLLNQAEREDLVDVVACVSALRWDRPQMVQSESQYRFIYDALLEALYIADVAIPVKDFDEKMLDRTACTKHQKSILEQEYDALNMLFPLEDAPLSFGITGNKDKIRDMSVISMKDNIVYTDQNWFINASLCDSYMKKDAFILTQTPLPHTEEDYWRLVLDQGVSAIVAIQPYEKTASRYRCGPFTVHGDTEPTARSTARIVYKTVTLHKSMRSYSLPEWQIPVEMTDPFLDDYPEEVSEVRNMMVRHLCNPHITGPVVVQCADGVELCSMFVAMCYVLDKLESTRLVDVVYAVKQVRQSRAKAVRTYQQYRQLHNITACLLRSQQAEYYNFV